MCVCDCVSIRLQTGRTPFTSLYLRLFICWHSRPCQRVKLYSSTTAAAHRQRGLSHTCLSVFIQALDGKDNFPKQTGVRQLYCRSNFLLWDCGEKPSQSLLHREFVCLFICLFEARVQTGRRSCFPDIARSCC